MNTTFIIIIISSSIIDYFILFFYADALQKNHLTNSILTRS